MPLASRIGLLRAALQLELPFSRWDLDEVAGSAFADLGGAAVPMSHVGTWADLTTGSLVQGLGGTSAYTDGAAYATAAAGVASHTLSQLTFSFYYQRDSSAAKHVLFSCGDGGQAGDLSIEVLANGRLRGWHVGQDVALRFFDGSGGVVGTSLAVGTAHRIDLALGPLGARLYLDGAALSAASILPNTNGWNNARVKYLGRYSNGVLSPAVGAFDRVRLWPRQLTPAEIATLAPARRIQLPGYRFIEAETGHLVATGYDAGLLQHRRLAAETGHLVATGYDAGLLQHRRLAAETGHLVATGYDAELSARTNVLAAETGHLVATGYDAGLLQHRRLAAGTGHLLATGYDAVLRRRPVPLAAETGHLVATGYDAVLSTVVSDVEFVNKSALYTAGSNTTSHTLSTFAFAATGANRKGVLGVSQNNSTALSSAAYNGVALSQVGSLVGGSFGSIQLFYIDDANIPTDGAAHNTVLTYGSNVGPIFGWSEYKNVAQGAAAASGTDDQVSGNVSVALASTGVGDLIVDVANNIDNGTFSQTGTATDRTERFDGNGAPQGHTLVMSDVVGGAGGTVTMGEDCSQGARSVEIAARWAKAA